MILWLKHISGISKLVYSKLIIRLPFIALIASLLVLRLILSFFSCNYTMRELGVVGRGGGVGGGGLKPPITFIRSNMVYVNEFVSRGKFSVTLY